MSRAAHGRYWVAARDGSRSAAVAQEFCPQRLSLRNNAPKAHNPSFLEIIVLEIIVGQESAVVVSFQPMIQVNLVEVRCDHLFSQLMRLRT